MQELVAAKLPRLHQHLQSIGLRHDLELHTEMYTEYSVHEGEDAVQDLIALRLLWQLRAVFGKLLLQQTCRATTLLCHDDFKLSRG